ncbi:hypothetical protein PIB30_012155 [Stylosanthes scabra]|uniref:Uncharacterized protein n=1 Tax=Stylosanthes scabra TaxID=79078 RepID=A0ABU6T813_9FABA|nr:hypothetical protein [Stylosanthes scabra]
MLAACSVMPSGQRDSYYQENGNVLESNARYETQFQAKVSNARNRTGSRRNVRSRGPFSGSEDDELYLDTEKRAIHSNFKSGHSYSANQKRKGRGPTKKLSFGSDSDEDDANAGLFSDDDDGLEDVYSSRKNKGNKRDFSRPNKGTRCVGVSNGSMLLIEATQLEARSDMF